jgi:signal transduction histidine kinase
MVRFTEALHVRSAAKNHRAPTAGRPGAGGIESFPGTAAEIRPAKSDQEEENRPGAAAIGREQLVALSMPEMLSILNSSLPLEHVLAHIVSEASHLLGSDLSALYIQSPNGHGYEMKAVSGSLPDASVHPLMPVQLAKALEAGSHVLVCDLGITPGGTEDAIRASIAQLADCCQAFLAIPLRFSDQTGGALVLYYSQPAGISDEDVALGWSFGNQAALAIQRARLQGQIAELSTLAERERTARDLHDSVVQSLYSLNLLAAGWRRLAQAGNFDSIEAILVEVGDLTQQALREMHVLVHALRPPELASEGLLGTLHRRLEAVEKRAGVEARLISDTCEELPAPIEEALYHIALEALNNATKHGNPTSVTIRLRAK